MIRRVSPAISSFEADNFNHELFTDTQLSLTVETSDESYGIPLYFAPSPPPAPQQSTPDNNIQFDSIFSYLHSITVDYDMTW